jgi:16S rRNA (guanine1207-N2)-methyltransferase
MSLFDADNLATFRQDLEVTYDCFDKTFCFKTAWGIFSPKQIDDGTKQLLKYITVAQDEHIFDLGCGYGPLGICLGSQAPNGSVLMVDRDFLAVDYCRKNIQLNNLANAECQLSNGFQHIDADRKFTMVVSNLPAKVGNEMMSLFLNDAYQHLQPGGRLVVVHILGLKNFIKRGFKEVFGNYHKLKQSKNYIVAETVRFE